MYGLMQIVGFILIVGGTVGVIVPLFSSSPHGSPLASFLAAGFGLALINLGSVGRQLSELSTNHAEATKVLEQIREEIDELKQELRR